MQELNTPHGLRRALEKCLGDDACYLRIQPDSKHPVGSYLPGRRNRLLHIPRQGNYGIIPQHQLFILDFDHHKGTNSVHNQVNFFSSFLKVDLRQSLAVMTQSGGLHVYLRFPRPVALLDEGLPKASLRPYSEAFSQLTGTNIQLDADIRSGIVNGYVVGPGSQILLKDQESVHPTYSLADESFGFSQNVRKISVLTISDDSMARLSQVVQLREELETAKKRRIERRRIIRSQEEAPEGFLSASESAGDLSHAKPSPEVLALLRKALTQRSEASYHARRAFLKSALHCCHDDYSMAIACIELGIDKDSYTGSSIGFRALIADLSRFHPRSRYHGIYCYKGRKALSQHRKFDTDAEFDLNEHLKRVERKLSQPGGMARTTRETRLINPRVLDVGKISLALLGKKERHSIPQQYFHCLSIVDYFLQPLSNVGATRILMARKPMARWLKLTPSQITQAMRVLRQTGIIRLEQKQRTGLAPTYSVPEDYTHQKLTRILRRTWSTSESLSDTIAHPSIYFERTEGQFRQVFGENIIPPCLIRDENIYTMIESWPSVFNPWGAGAAAAYLREEAEEQNLIVDSTTEHITVMNSNTGEFLNETIEASE